MNTYCAERYDDGVFTGTCVPLADNTSNGCLQVKGTHPVPLLKYIGGVEVSHTVEIACVPPETQGITCTNAVFQNGQYLTVDKDNLPAKVGECVDVNQPHLGCSAMGGSVKPGFCPGGANIQCCLYQ